MKFYNDSKRKWDRRIIDLLSAVEVDLEEATKNHTLSEMKTKVNSNEFYDQLNEINMLLHRWLRDLHSFKAIELN